MALLSVGDSVDIFHAHRNGSIIDVTEFETWDRLFQNNM